MLYSFFDIGGVVTLSKQLALSAVVGTLALIVVGCSPSKPLDNQTPTVPKSVLQPRVKMSKQPVDGTLASINEINTYQSYTGTDVKVYQVFYWSNGYKVEAYLTEPTKPGKYPLLVNLHGGAAWRGTPPSSLGYTAKVAAYLANAQTVMLYPEYEGYMESQGQVMGAKTDMADVTNAITAAKSLGEVKTNDTYVIGYSLGGGLALMTATQDHEVKAVVAVSPFVGLTDFAQWATRYAKPGSTFYEQLQVIEKSYGTNINSPAYQDRSPNIKDIQAPVLMLQGTADHHVAWQTVQTFAKQMKEAHKTVKLVLYPGGHHGLHTVPYQSESTQAMDSWFEKYGLNLQ